MNWQPIETAPRNGAIVLVTDGVLFAAAIPFDYVEPYELGFDNRPLLPDTRRPNPNAGQVRALWHSIGCTAFLEDAVVFDGAHNCPVSILRPTHWVPLPDAPT